MNECPGRGTAAFFAGVGGKNMPLLQNSGYAVSVMRKGESAHITEVITPPFDGIGPSVRPCPCQLGWTSNALE